MKKLLFYFIFLISNIGFSQQVFLGTNPATVNYDRSVILVNNRFEADCIVKVVNSHSVSERCGYWMITKNQATAKYKFLLTTPYSNQWFNGRRPIKIYITKSWFYSKKHSCDCDKLLN